MSFEFWINYNSTLEGNEGWIQYNDNYPTGSGEGNGAEIRGQIIGDSFYLLGQTAGVFISQVILSPLVKGMKNQLVITIDLEAGVVQGYLNGDTQDKYVTSASIINKPYNSLFELFNLFALTTQNIYATGLTDEFRIYSEVLSDLDVSQGWNNGVGLNPIRTDKLIVWYQFEKFEMLDFSQLQDRSNVQLGIQDMSSNNNHALPINMNTNPDSPTYVIESF